MPEAGTLSELIYKTYYRDVGSRKVLTNEEEVALGRKMRLLREELTYTPFIEEPIYAFNFIIKLSGRVRNGSIDIRDIMDSRKKDLHSRLENGVEKLKAIKYKIRKIRKEEVRREYIKRGIEVVDELGFRQKVFYGLIEKGASDEKLSKNFRSEIKRLKDEYKLYLEDFTKANLRLVVTIARRFYSPKMSFFDIIQHGNIGLINAVEKFDERRGVKFSTYAEYWIRQEIIKAKSKSALDIYVGINEIHRFFRYRGTSQDLNTRFEREPTEEEVAHELGLKIEKVRELSKIPYGPDFLSINSTSRGSNNELEERLVTQSEYSIEDDVNVKMIGERVRKVLARLSPRERDVIYKRFGLYDDKDITLRETGDQLGVTRERIRQIEQKAFKKLRKSRELKSIYDSL